MGGRSRRSVLLGNSLPFVVRLLQSSQSSEEQQEVARPTNPSPSLPSAKRPLFVDDEENDSMAEPTKSDEKTAEANDVEEAVKVEATDRVVGDAPKESEQKDSKTKESEEKDSEKKDKEKPNEEEKALKSKPERPAVSVAPIAVPTELSPQPSPQASPSAKREWTNTVDRCLRTG